MSTFAFIANYDSDNVSVIDVSTNTIVDTISVGLNPRGIAITPDGNFAYVTNFGLDKVSVIDINTNTIVETIFISTNADPYGIAITPDGNFVYVTNCISNTVSVIDISTNTIVETINVGQSPRGIAMLNISQPQIDLSITKSDSPNPVRIGENLTYNITVGNNSLVTATEVKLIDTLPEDAVYISASSTKGICSESDGIVTCNLTTIDKAETVTVTINVVPNTTGYICNRADVSANESDSDISNNTVIKCTTVLEQLTTQELIDNLIDYINIIDLGVIRFVLKPLLIITRWNLYIGLVRVAILSILSFIIITRVLMLVQLIPDEAGQEIIYQANDIITIIESIYSSDE